MLSTFSLGLGSGIDDAGKSLDTKVNLNGDLLFRVTPRAHAGLEVDLNTWSWSNPSGDASRLNDTSKVTVGRAGFLGSFRMEAPKGKVNLLGQVGIGIFSNNLNISGGGVNGAPANPAIAWGPGYNLQAGLGYRFATIRLSNKHMFMEAVDRNWFGISVGIGFEYF